MLSIRKALMVGVCFGALLSGQEAHAELPVIDGANLLNTARSVVQGAQQIQQLQQQITTMVQQLRQMQNIFASVAHPPQSALNSVGSAMNTNSTIRFPLPSPTSMGTLLNGSGLGSMGSLGQQYLNENRVATPTGSDFRAQQMTTNANSIAGVQAAADNLQQSTTTHIQNLQQLEGALAASPDEKATADISARVQLENTYIAAQQVQATSLQTWQAAQVRNQQEQADEAKRQNIDDVINQANANGAGG